VPGLFEDEVGGKKRDVHVKDVLGAKLPHNDLIGRLKTTGKPVYFVEAEDGCIPVEVEQAVRPLGGDAREELKATGKIVDFSRLVETFLGVRRGEGSLIHEKLISADSVADVASILEGVDVNTVNSLMFSLELRSDETKGMRSPEIMAEIGDRLLTVIGRYHKQRVNDPVVGALPDNVAGAYYNRIGHMLAYGIVRPNAYCGQHEAAKYADSVYCKPEGERPQKAEVKSNFDRALQGNIDEHVRDGFLLSSYELGLLRDNSAAVLDKHSNSWDRSRQIAARMGLDDKFMGTFMNCRYFLVVPPTPEQVEMIRHPREDIASVRRIAMEVFEQETAPDVIPNAESLTADAIENTIRGRADEKAVGNMLSDLLQKTSQVKKPEQHERQKAEDVKTLIKNPGAVIELVRAWR